MGTRSKQLGSAPRPCRIAAALLAAGALIAAGPAVACTDLQFRSLGQQTWVGSRRSGYDVFDASQIVRAVMFQVRKRGAAGCDFFVTASTGNGGGFGRELRAGADAVMHNLYTGSTPANVIEDLSVGNPTVLAASAPAGGNSHADMTFYWSIDPSQVVDSAIYQDTITFSLYEGTTAASTLHDTVNVRFRAAVSDTTELSLVDTGGGFDETDLRQNLNFPNLTRGATLGFDLLIRTNTGYDITMSSDNRGVLVMTGAHRDVSEIPYILRLDSVAIDLGAARTTIAVPTGATMAAGNRHVVEVEIGEVGNASAGTYEDNVTVTVSSK